jgi:PQQ-like domain
VTTRTPGRSSSAAHRTAPQTYFTKYFADLIEKGIPGLPAELRLHQVFTKLRDNLSRDQRTVPDQRSIDAAREFVFAHSAAPPGGVAVAVAPPGAEVALSPAARDEPGTGVRAGLSVTNPERPPARPDAPPACLRPEAPPPSRPLMTRRRALISLGAAAAVAGISAVGWELSQSGGHTSRTPPARIVPKIPSPTPSHTPPPGTRLWQFTAQGPVGSRPTVSGGVVYSGSDDHNLYAVQA